MIDYFLTRRSTKLAHMTQPGPTHEEIETILKVGARTPDHGKYVPWYFIVFEGTARNEFGQVLRHAYAQRDPDATDAKLDLESEKFLRAPTIIAVISRIKRGKHPQWEQILSAGAVCMNICHAANSLGYGTNWLSEWIAYDPHIRTSLKLDDHDHIAGFIYIGTPTQKNEERERPNMAHITNFWSKDFEPQKGDAYEMENSEIPPPGFTPRTA